MQEKSQMKEKYKKLLTDGQSYDIIALPLKKL
jgi:hypothetical protein